MTTSVNQGYLSLSLNSETVSKARLAGGLFQNLRLDQREDKSVRAKAGPCGDKGWLSPHDTYKAVVSLGISML